MSETIRELKDLIKTDRIEAAKARLALLGRRSGSEEDQQEVLQMLALASDRTGLALIDFLLAQEGLDHAVQERLFQLATDRAHLNYEFTGLLLTHGSKEQVRHIIPLLKHILSKATKGDLLNLILRSAGKLKLTPLTDAVAEFIFYDDDALKRESVKALERMGTGAALKHLEHIAGTDKCDADILDAIEMIREKLEQDKAAETPPTGPAQQDLPPHPSPEIHSMSGRDEAQLAARLSDLSSDSLDKRLEAYEWFSANRHMVTEGLHRSLETGSHDLLINLLRLTARTIPQQAIGDLITLAAREEMETSLRFALLTALAAFPELESAATVLDLAGDTSLIVRLAAVKVLDRHCSDYIAAEVKNRIETGTKKAEALGVTILDAGAVRLIDALMASDTFSYIASNYLERSAPVNALDAFIQVLEKRGRTSTVKKYRRIRLERAGQHRPFFVVIHPTRAYLDVYTKVIHNCGFDARCFTAPQEAFESIVFEKPAGVICDLFIRQTTVLELAGEIRELYPEKEVPLIVSTLQRGLDNDQIKKQFREKSITALCGFPAKPSQIKSWGSGK